MADTPHRDEPRPLMIGGDWSTGLNTPTSLNQTQILGALGMQLRSTYQDLLNEPVPAHLTAFVHRLAERDDGQD